MTESTNAQVGLSNEPMTSGEKESVVPEEELVRIVLDKLNGIASVVRETCV